ncbi:MAG: hypothetical protein KC543_02830 [Myxococcales bacterium]|nr:hypothetical protein [Myxococcales bacterium]
MAASFSGPVEGAVVLGCIKAAAAAARSRARVDRCCAALWCLVHRPRW